VLPAWASLLRRGKGTFWVAEDRRSRWEWQASGRLRYSVQRVAEGFAGAAPSSGIVLIFGPEFSAADEDRVRQELEGLLEEPQVTPVAAGQEALAHIVLELLGGEPAFELLDPPLGEEASAAKVLRFRLSGRKKFGIAPDADLSEPPFKVDVDGMNRELAALVCMAMGGRFLGASTGRDVGTGQTCVALLWPLGITASSVDGSMTALCEPAFEVINPFEETLAAARAESDALLSRFFAHVQSCPCGQ